jgi:hypothetical protein
MNSKSTRTKQKVGVSARALIQRVNRKLTDEHQRLHVARLYRDSSNRRWENSNLGRYYVIDFYRNIIRDTHVDLEKLGRELRVLQPWEELSE